MSEGGPSRASALAMDESTSGTDWLEHATELCEFCCSAYHPDLAAYCLVCDRGLCLFCIVRVGSASECCPGCEAEPPQSSGALDSTTKNRALSESREGEG